MIGNEVFFFFVHYECYLIHSRPMDARTVRRRHRQDVKDVEGLTRELKNIITSSELKDIVPIEYPSDDSDAMDSSEDYDDYSHSDECDEGSEKQESDTMDGSNDCRSGPFSLTKNNLTFVVNSMIIVSAVRILHALFHFYVF